MLYIRPIARDDVASVLALSERSGSADADRIVGISAIEAAVGLTEPFYNFHLGTLVHASRALDTSIRSRPRCS